MSDRHRAGPGYENEGYDGQGYDRGYGDPGRDRQVNDRRGYDRGHGDPGRDRHGYHVPGHGYDVPHDNPGYGNGAHGNQGYADRGHDRGYDDRDHPDPAYPGEGRPWYAQQPDPRDRGQGQEHPRPGHGAGWGVGTPRYDPDATVLLPAVPADTTVVLPVFQPNPPLPPAGPPGGPPTVREGEDDGRSVARNSAMMAAGSVASRLTGFLRTAVLAAALGAFAVSNDYNLANTVPNQVYELLLGGVLDSSFIPLLVRARRRDPDGGEAYAQRLLTLTAIFLAAATAVAVLAAPLIGLLFHNRDTTPAGQHLTTVFSYLLLPEIFFYGMAAMIAAILNTRGHFAAPMWTPILNNIVVIATLVLFMLLPSVTRPPSPGNISTAQILVLGLGTTLGIAVQAGGLLPALRKVGFRWKPRWDWRELHLRELFRISSWMLVYVMISQVALVTVLWISNRAGSQHLRGGQLAPGPAIFNNAYILFMMANGIVAVSIMTALMPRMSAAASEHRWEDLSRHLSMGTRLSAVILVPTSVAYIVLGRQLGVTLFGWRDYAGTPAVQTGWVIAAAGIGLVPFAISQLQLFAFYAMPDTKTPAMLNLPVAGLRVALDLILLVALPVVWVDAGLMIGNAASFLLSAVAGYWLLRRRVGQINLSGTVTTLGKLAGAGVIAAVPTLLVALILQHWLGLSKVGGVVGLVVGGLVLVVVYLAAAVALRVREINEVWGMVRGRLGR